MANVGMKTIGAKAIAAALCANQTLETLDLSGNNFGCKADVNAWESASELLSFGLQARSRSSMRSDRVLAFGESLPYQDQADNVRENAEYMYHRRSGVIPR